MNIVKYLPVTFVLAGLAYGAKNPALTVVALGGETPSWTNKVGATGSYSGETYTLTGNGHDFYWCWDRGGFAFTEVEGDFSFSTTIKQAPSGSPAKFGIMVRENLTTAAMMIDFRFDTNQGSYTWFLRAKEGSVCATGSCEQGSCVFTSEPIDLSDKDGVDLKIEKKGGQINLYHRKSGSSNWSKVDQSLALTANKLYVGLSTTSGDRGNVSATTTYSNIELVTGSASTALYPGVSASLPAWQPQEWGYNILGIPRKAGSSVIPAKQFILISPKPLATKN